MLEAAPSAGIVIADRAASRQRQARGTPPSTRVRRSACPRHDAFGGMNKPPPTVDELHRRSRPSSPRCRAAGWAARPPRRAKAWSTCFGPPQLRPGEDEPILQHADPAHQTCPLVVMPSLDLTHHSAALASGWKGRLSQAPIYRQDERSSATVLALRVIPCLDVKDGRVTVPDAIQVLKGE